MSLSHYHNPGLNRKYLWKERGGFCKFWLSDGGWWGEEGWQRRPSWGGVATRSVQWSPLFIHTRYVLYVCVVRSIIEHVLYWLYKISEKNLSTRNNSAWRVLKIDMKRSFQLFLEWLLIKRWLLTIRKDLLISCITGNEKVIGFLTVKGKNYNFRRSFEKGLQHQRGG